MNPLKTISRNLIEKTVKLRRPGAYNAYVFACRIVAAYENHDVDMARNGERWLVRQLAKRGPVTALDVGANQGEWAEALLEYAPEARLFCFEPVPATFAALQAAVSGPNVSLNNLAMSSEAGKLTIHAVADNPYIASVYSGDLYQPDLDREAIEITATTGDAVIAENALEKIDIVKIDAEGHDYDVLAGFKQAVADGIVDMFQFEYNIFTLEARRSLNDFVKFLSPEYVLCRLLPNGLEACGYHAVLDNFGQSNWVAVRIGALDADLVERLSIRPARGLPGLKLSELAEEDPRLGILF